MSRNIGYITKALSGISSLRDICIDSDMTKQLQGTKTDFMDANRVPLEKINPVQGLQGSQQTYQVSEEGHSMAGTRTSVYFGDFKETGINPNLKV